MSYGLTPQDPRIATAPGTEFRTALSTFPTGVTVVTTNDEDGTAIGVTVNSFVSLSLAPPLIMWSLSVSAKCRRAFETARRFTVNVLAHDQQAVAYQFARPVEDRFSAVRHTRLPNGGVVLDGAVSWFNCETDRAIEAGDHIAFIGRVTEFRTRDTEPLIFWRSRFLEDRFTRTRT